MKRENLIKCLNEIVPYVKLSVLCEEYNTIYPDNAIDYNNLRVTLSGKAPNRLSTEKLYAFYDFLTKDIFEKRFRMNCNKLFSTEIASIVETKTDEIKQEIAEALKHGF